MEILFATGNAHKAQEMNQILAGHRLLLPRDLGLSFDFDETGTTFRDNAFGKAQALFDLAGGRYPVLADDSGLCVAALNGAPGVYSARYGSAEAGRPLTDLEKNQLLLKTMAGQSDRRAWFVCNLVLILSPDRFFMVQETFAGQLLTELRGQGGFGYDPVLYLPEHQKTVAELDPSQKNSLSHRGKAALKLQKLIEKEAP